MHVEKDAVVTIHYTLRNDAGETLDSSIGGEPLAYMQGNGHIIPGLENALEGKRAGDKVSVQVNPRDGYGEYDQGLQVPRQAFKGVSDVQVGMQFQVSTPQGARVVNVTNVAGDMVTIDGNHPLAGQNLNFDVEITDVRAATREELAHGHVHGPGGHDHE